MCLLDCSTQPACHFHEVSCRWQAKELEHSTQFTLSRMCKVVLHRVPVPIRWGRGRVWIESSAYATVTNAAACIRAYVLVRAKFTSMARKHWRTISVATPHDRLRIAGGYVRRAFTSKSRLWVLASWTWKDWCHPWTRVFACWYWTHLGWVLIW